MPSTRFSFAAGVWCFCLLTVVAAPGVGAELGGLTVTDALQSQETKQQQIKSTTQKVGDQLDGIITEFDRNGITGEDVTVLRAIRGVLGRLSAEDMQKVITLLQQSRAANDPAASARQATEAFAGQKTIIVQLQQLVLEYQRQQALYEISLRLKELASRQSANMWLGVGLAKSVQGKSGFSAFDENQKISVRYQQSEQAPLREETTAILRKLETLAREITDGVTAERPRAALQQAKDGGVMAALDAAVNELREDNLKLLSAIGNEKRARDQLREIARLLILSQNPADALKQALQELDRAIDAQKGVRAQTGKVKRRDEAEKRATEQAAVVDDTDLIRKDIDSLAPVAAEHLRNSTDRMQEARSALGANDDPKQRVEKAMPSQEDALAQMQLARHALEEQIARLEAVEEKPKDALTELKELQEEVRELAKQEETLKQEAAAAEAKQLPTKAPRQGELKDKAQDLQTRAAERSPEAASALNDASSQMHRSQNSLASQQNNPAAQQAAIDALQRAEQQLAEDIARLEQAEKDLALLEELLKRLVAIIEQEQQVEAATAKQAVRPQPEPDALKALALRQDQLAHETGDLQPEATKPAPRAAEYIGSAARKMSAAKSELDQQAARAAQVRETEALADLYLAKRELERRIEELQEMLGQPSGQGEDALAEAQRRIEEAQRKVNEALSDLRQAPSGLMETLQKQQQEIADALNQARQDSPESRPLDQAHQAAEKAAQQLAQSDIPKAIESMKRARSGIAQAQPNGQQGDSPALEKLSQHQADVQKTAEAMMDSQEKAPASAMQSASEALQDAGETISPMTSGRMGRMPAGVQSALQSAQRSTSQGSAQASAGQNTPSQMSATDAANALAQAKAALALAQAGLGSQPNSGQGQPGGQGKTPGPGQGQGKGKGTPSPQGTGNDGNWTGDGGADGGRAATTGAGTFTRLPGRDRDAIQQSQSEKYPQEYGPLVEQYLKNLSDQGGGK